MPHPLIATLMIAALIAALLIYRELVIALVKAGGPPCAIGIVVVAYLLARLIHHRQSRGY